MNVFLQDGRFTIRDSWYDHSDAQLGELLEHVGLSATGGIHPSEHGCACNCDDCRAKRGEEKLDPKKDFESAMKAHEDGTAFKIETFKL